MLPQTLKPMLATMAANPFDSPDYIYEIKWDGYRCLSFIEGSNTRLQSRNLKDITTVFPELTNLHQKFYRSGCLVDGEIIALRDGKPSFLELQKRGQLRNTTQILMAVKTIPIIYIIFDLLFYNGKSITDKPLEARKTLLEEVLKPTDEVVISRYIETKGLDYFKSTSALGLEGVIAKKKGTPYLSGKRVKTWLKFKQKKSGNFLICGYVLNPKSGQLRSLILGAYQAQKLQLFGMVGTGFTQTELAVLQTELTKLNSSICPFTGTAVKQKDVTWVTPRVVCSVDYFELTDDGSLRHPSFQQICPEILPDECQF